MSAFLDAAVNLDLVLLDDSARTLSYVFTDENGNAIDCSDSTLSLAVKARDANDAPTGSVLLTLTSGAGIAGDLSLGEFQPTFAADALAVGAYIFELRRLVDADPVEVLLVGRIDVKAGLS